MLIHRHDDGTDDEPRWRAFVEAQAEAGLQDFEAI